MPSHKMGRRLPSVPPALTWQPYQKKKEKSMRLCTQKKRPVPAITYGKSAQASPLQLDIQGQLYLHTKPLARLRILNSLLQILISLFD